MAKKLTNQQSSEANFGVMKFDSIKVWISKNGKIFYMLRFGKNTCFVSSNLLEKIKKEAA